MTTTTLDAPATGRRVTPTGILILPAAAPRDAWLAARRDGITATDLPQIVGASPYGSAADVYADKVGRPLVADDLSEAGEWGVLLEDTVARKWADDRGLQVRRTGLIAHATEPWMRASLDRLVTGCTYRPGTRCAAEIKTRNAYVADQWADGVPDSVLVQTQWQLLVSGLDHIHVAALIGGQRLVEHTVVADPVTCDYLVDQGRTVWQCVVDNVPPVIDPALLTTDLLDRIHPNRAGIVDVPVDVAAQHLADYAHYGAVEKEAAAAKEAAKVQLLALLGDGEEARIGDRIAYTFKAGKDSTTVPADNVKALLADHPDIAARYVVTKPASRRFNVSKGKAA